MSQYTPGVKVSLEADDTLAAFIVVGQGARAHTVNAWQTSSSHVLGVTEALADSGAAASIIVSGTAKVTCNASIPAFSLVGPVTGSAGLIAAITVNTATTFPKLLGIALENGSTNGVIEVLLQPTNRTAGI
jgi:hypothetical protein